MRILCLFVCFAVFEHCIDAHASDQKFPYEAVVDVDQGESVLSGPGTKYYPTQKLKNGDRVMVHRHDPGGWCMISPPRGSFSWVRASNVERDESDSRKGWIKTNRVIVHTGSTLNPDDFSTWQADLSKGDAVEILGEREFPLDDGPRLMLKISPVKGEWRWISRKSIVSVDAYRSSPFHDEQSEPKRRSGPVADGDAFAQPVSTGNVIQNDRRDSTGNDVAERRNRADQDAPSGKERLAVLDQQFRDMIKQDPPTWDLDSLETQYQQLDDEVGQKSMTASIVLRHDAVKRYRKIYRDYVDFYKLSSDTKQRDAELQMRQSQTQLTSSDPQSAGNNSDTQPVPQPQTPQVATVPPQGNVPAFDGAGIVQRMAKTFPGGPQYVLISPDGRMLSFLQAAPGVDLNRYNGRSMGIVGQRIHRDDWNADIITVRSLQPVQFRSGR